MISAIAIDDEPIALEIIENFARMVPFVDLKACFTDAFEAMDYLLKTPVDLVFLDIKMPDISGIDFLNSLTSKPMVIFTTAYPEHAVVSFELDAIDYLLKPFSLPRFIKACNKVHEIQSLRKGTESEYLFLKTGYDQVKVLLKDIDYLEAAGNYVNFIMKDKNLLSRTTFNELERLLPPNKFIRIHRCYMASVGKIDKIERHCVTINGKQLPVGRVYLEGLQRSRFGDY